MRFPAKKKAGCPKAPRDFAPRKDGILHPPSGCLANPLPLPQSLYGRTDGRTLTSQPKFLGSIEYQITLAMVLRWHAGARATLKRDFRITSPKGPGPNAFLFGTSGRTCSRHSRITHETT